MRACGAGRGEERLWSGLGPVRNESLISSRFCGGWLITGLQRSRNKALGRQNDYGQIGSGSNENAVVPRFVECVHHVSKAACGANHNLVLTGDGRLFQWGCGRACGNRKRNILSPEEVKLRHSPVRDVAGGCWHSLLLTDGGNVFSWGMGQEGQLGLGEDKIHISTPCLLSYSESITQIQAGDSYSAAVTAGGELLHWGQVPCMSQVSDHPGLKRLWTPQPVPLAGRKVCEVACGTWHITALATTFYSGSMERSREKNKECAHPESETCLRDLVSNPPPTEHAENRITAHVFKQVHHKLPQGQGRSEGSDEQEKDEESVSGEEEEIKNDRPKKDEGDGSLHSSAFAKAKSATGMDKTGNDHSSIKSDQEDEREGCRTTGPCELRKQIYRSRGSRDVIFTTLHLLPRPEGEQCRSTASALPRLLTGQAHSRVLTQPQKEGSTHLAEMVKKSGSYSSVLQSSKLKPKPPGKCTDLGAQRVASRHHSRIRPHTGLESAIYNSSPQLSPGQQVQIPSCSINTGPQVETALSPPPTFSEPSGDCPTHRRAVSSLGVSRKNL
ncbi:hypothetical protein Q5P01_014622 [Channa striata]|uniref:Uncharacterized protein n=1 Tax=Channa striata TaxID=64152 RepID=A0AA88SFE4_CHASR|nr:hypothetical protein Q5P01_014622 [Channa striata]